MTDLMTLLDHSVDHVVDLDTGADVARGRAALTRRRRLWAAGVTAAVLVVGGSFSVAARASHHDGASPAATGPTVRAGAFEIPPPPAGWSVQAADESVVVIAPEGMPKVDLHTPNLQLTLVGKMTLHFMKGDADVPKSGPPVEYDGRTFYAWTNPAVVDVPGYDDSPAISMASIQTSSGWLVLEGAPRLHWTRQQLLEYLDGVVPTSDAVPSS